MISSSRIFALALCSAIVLISAQTSFGQPTLPANGLVAHLPGDGNEDDVSGNDNGGDGTFPGSGYSTGLFGQAFDPTSAGNDFVEIPDPDLDLDLLGTAVSGGGTGAMSMGAWVKYTSSEAGQGIVYKHSMASGSNVLQTRSVVAPGGIDFAVRDTSPGTNNINTTASYNDGEWHSIIGVFDDATDTHVLYVDGGDNNDGETAFGAATDMLQTDAKYNIGAFGAGGSNFFSGLIDEVFLYDRALTEQEVIAIANNQSGPVAPDTDFSWNTDSLGDWNTASNWTAALDAPPGDPNNVFYSYHTATFGDKITANRTVVTDSAVSLRKITFENMNSYNVSGHGSVNMVASTATAAPPTQIAVNLGSHQFQAIVGLATNTTVDVASGSTLEFNNRLLLGGNTLTKTGLGTVAISNDVVSGGGSISLQQGSLVGSGTVGGDVDNNGGTVSPGDSSLDANSVVPEPAAWVMLALGLLGAMARLRNRWR